MFFEGSEKKIEVVFKGLRLRDLGEEFWSQVVRASKAQILSKVSSQECDAYLLSESSLFVWDHRFTMITCGQTTLAQAAAFCIQHLGTENVELLIYERKNEYLPEEQETHFFDDTKILKSLVPGKSYCFGEEDEHHVYLFHSTLPYTPPQGDVTLEVLMYGLQGAPREIFNQRGHTSESLRRCTGVDQILPDFTVDDFVFEPFGYSLNAVKGSEYYTIHVTPQDCSSYVSFETNAKIDQNYLPVLNNVINVFNPKSFDVITFRSCTQEFIEVPGFQIHSATKQELSCGYTVNHSHFEQESSEKINSIIYASKIAKELREL